MVNLVTRRARAGQLMPSPNPRRPRSPKHPFYVSHRPFSIQPFHIQPVLPRETLKLLMWQSRAVTEPVVSPLIGHWLEYYYFYVKHRDLNERAELTDMMLQLDHGTGVTPAAATDAKLYTAQGSVPWVRMCLQRIVECYFRAPGEAWDAEVDADGLPVAQIVADHWLDSFTWESEMPEGPNVDVDLNADTTITAREVQVAMQQYELLRNMGLVDMTYEEYLMTHGVSQPVQEEHKPELIRYVRSWEYPVSHIATEGVTGGVDVGTPTSAVSWKISERADKDRFFSEPGFIFGVTLWRPKIYLGGQIGTACGLLDNLLAWLPKVMSGDGSVSLRKFEAANALLPNLDPDDTPGPADPYWIDLRDLFLYGEQFVSGSVPSFDLPDANGRRRYPAQADISALFVGENETMRQDGIVMSTILGDQVDNTLSTPRPTRAT